MVLKSARFLRHKKLVKMQCVKFHSSAIIQSCKLVVNEFILFLANYLNIQQRNYCQISEIRNQKPANENGIVQPKVQCLTKAIIFGLFYLQRATLMPVYHCHKPVLLGKWHCFKFATSHKNMSPSMPTWLFDAFFIRMNP